MAFFIIHNNYEGVKNMNQNFMKEKPILPLVISMSLPMVISMAINSLYNIVDSYFVAKISEDAMTAISLVYPLQNLMTAIAVGFGIAMNARIAFCILSWCEGSGESGRGSGHRHVLKCDPWNHTDDCLYGWYAAFSETIYEG